MIGISASIKCRMTRRAHTNSDLQIQVTKSDLQDQQLNKKLHSNKKTAVYMSKKDKNTIHLHGSFSLADGMVAKTRFDSSKGFVDFEFTSFPTD